MLPLNLIRVLGGGETGSGKKKDSNCMISNNDTITRIEISFKEKDIKYLNFLFEFYIDDPTRKAHGWELFDHLSPRKR